MVSQCEMLRIMAEEIAEHVDHQKHGADEVQNSSLDGIPEALRVGLVLLRRNVLIYANGNSDEHPRSDVPVEDGHGQSNDVPDTVGEVEEEEYVAHEAVDQRRHVDPVAPFRVVIRPSLQLRQSISVVVVEVHPPRGNQCGKR